MKKVLITGVTGFLGQYIARELSSSGWKVVGLDCSEPQNSDADKIGLSDFQMIKLPSRDLDGLLAPLQPDVIVHAAGPSSVQKSIIDPAGDYEGSVNVTFQLLDAVRRLTPHSRLIFLSSAAVYGNPDRVPVGEDAKASPVSPYGHHKLICENLMREFHELYGLKNCIARIFSAYGNGLKRQVLWDISQQILYQKSLELSGNGEETRDFIHAEDVAGAVRLIINHADFQSEIYNVASGVETRIADLAGLIMKAMGGAYPVRFNGVRREGDPVRWAALTSRLSEIGFNSRVSMVDGVAYYVKWVLQDGDRK